MNRARCGEPRRHIAQCPVRSRAFYRAIALTGLGQAEDGIGELQAAASSRTEHETGLDDADTALLERFRDPPMPGLELLLRFFGLAT